MEEGASFPDLHSGAPQHSTFLLLCRLRLTSVYTVLSIRVRVKLVIFLKFRETDLAGGPLLVQTTYLCEIKESTLSRPLTAIRHGIFMIYLTLSVRRTSFDLEILSQSLHGSEMSTV